MNGFRFIYRPGSRGCGFTWAHPLELKQGDVDCTDMGDDEFTQFVADKEAQAIEIKGQE